MSTTWTQADLEAVERTIAQGATTVKFKDRTVEYQSLSNLFRIRDMIRRYLGDTATAGGRLFMDHSKGY